MNEVSILKAQEAMDHGVRPAPMRLSQAVPRTDSSYRQKRAETKQHLK